MIYLGPLIASQNYLQFFQLNQHKHYPDSPLICLLQQPYCSKQGNLCGADQSYASIYLLKTTWDTSQSSHLVPKICNPKPVFQLMNVKIAAAAITISDTFFLIISICNPLYNDLFVMLSLIKAKFLLKLPLQSNNWGRLRNCKSFLWSPSSSIRGDIFKGF